MKEHGGKRNGAGRKPKADEIRLIDELTEAITPEEWKEIWQAIGKEAKKGSAPHAKILLEYKHGRPKETIAHELPDNEIHITKKIINGTGA